MTASDPLLTPQASPGGAGTGIGWQPHARCAQLRIRSAAFGVKPLNWLADCDGDTAKTTSGSVSGS